MNKKLDVKIKVLLVEDSEHKYSKIIDYIESVTTKSHISHANDQIEAQSYLKRDNFDLVLLDMCLPLRKGDFELDKDGGEKILDELDYSDSLFQPKKIIALTEYEELHINLRTKFPELGAIKYINNSDDWKKSIYRTIKSFSKIKEDRIIIYCEEQNDKLYNLIGFSNLEFRGLKGGSRKVYEQAKFEKDKFAVRDKDYLTKNEVKWLTKSHMTNYIIIEYYCFENYLFHPKNISEYCTQKGLSFKIDDYIEEIIKQKNDKFLNIVQDYQIARNGYFDFTDNQKKNMDNEPEKDIVHSLKSNEFEIFYPYFDMKGTDKKKGFDKNCLNILNLNKEELVKTEWFFNKMNTFFGKLT